MSSSSSDMLIKFALRVGDVFDSCDDRRPSRVSRAADRLWAMTDDEGDKGDRGDRGEDARGVLREGVRPGVGGGDMWR